MDREQYDKRYDKIYEEVAESLRLLSISKKYFYITFTFIAVPDKHDINIIHYYFVFLPFFTGIEKKWKEESEKENGDPHKYNYEFENYPISRFFYIKDGYMTVPVEFYEKFFGYTKDILILKYDFITKKLDYPDYIFIGLCPPLCKIEYTNEFDYKELLDIHWFLNRERIYKDKLILEFTQPKLTPWESENIKIELSFNSPTFFTIK